MPNNATTTTATQTPAQAQPQTPAQAQPQTPAQKSYLAPFWVWVIILCAGIIFLLICIKCTEEEPAPALEETETVIPIENKKGNTVDADLLSVKFSKFQKAVLDWNCVSGDSWRWDSWDRARQGTALAAYVRAYDDLYITHDIDAGHEARVLWVYATCMIRISKAEGISYSEALDRIATKSVNELVRMLKKTALTPAYLNELNKFF